MRECRHGECRNAFGAGLGFANILHNRCGQGHQPWGPRGSPRPCLLLAAVVSSSHISNSWRLLGLCSLGPCCQVHCYELHGRFGHLVAPSVPARLQLAALYAATSTLLPEPYTHRATGAQVAMRLLRQCWGNRPLSAMDLEQLDSVSRLGGHLAPALHLLAHELRLSVWEVQELYPKQGDSRRRPCYDPGAATLYEHELKGGDSRTASAAEAGLAWWQRPQPANPRQLLTPGEQERVLGSRTGSNCGDKNLAVLDVAEPLPVPEYYVPSAEQQLAHLVAAAGAASQPQAQPYPLRAPPPPPAPAPAPAPPHPQPARSGRMRTRKTATAAAAGVGNGRAVPRTQPGAAGIGAGASVPRGDGGGGGRGRAAAAAAYRYGGDGGNPLEAEMHADLKASWDAHHAMATLRVKPGAMAHVQQLQVGYA